MKGLLRKMLGRKPKAAPAQTIVAPDYWESTEAFEAAKAHMAGLATQNPELLRAAIRGGAFNSPKMFLAANFPGAQVMQVAPMKPLTGVPEDDVMCFFAIDPDPNLVPRRILAAMMVVIPPEAPEGPRLPVAGEGLDHPVFKVAEAALLEQLQYMVGQRVIHTIMAVISIGIDLAVYKFSPEKGLEDIETEAVVVKTEPPTREYVRRMNEED